MGGRINPLTEVAEYHYAIDFAPVGTDRTEQVEAYTDGMVVYTGNHWSYGNNVIVQHLADNGKYYYTWYSHLTYFDVEVGQQVSTGDSLGRIGQSGTATGPHIHLSVLSGDRLDELAAEGSTIEPYHNNVNGANESYFNNGNGTYYYNPEYVFEQGPDFEPVH